MDNVTEAWVEVQLHLLSLLCVHNSEIKLSVDTTELKATWLYFNDHSTTEESDIWWIEGVEVWSTENAAFFS